MKLYERVSDSEVRLVPDSEDPAFEPIVVTAADGDVRVIAELLEALPGA